MLLQCAFLLSDAGNPPSVCLRQIFGGTDSQKLNETGGKTINNQPIIFNITYTPWKLKNNAAEEEREKSITKAEFGNLFSG